MSTRTKGPILKRGRRPILTCDNCRKRKAKCSRDSPCTLCRKSGVVCEWTAHDEIDARRREKTSTATSWKRSAHLTDSEEGSDNDSSSPRSPHQSASEASESQELSQLQRLVGLLQERYDIPEWEMNELKTLAETDSHLIGHRTPPVPPLIKSSSVVPPQPPTPNLPPPPSSTSTIEPWSALSPDSNDFNVYPLEDETGEFYFPTTTDFAQLTTPQLSYDALSPGLHNPPSLWLNGTPVNFPFLTKSADPRGTILAEAWS